MSSEDSDAGPRKKKPRLLDDSSASTSSGSPIIGSSSRVKTKRKRQQHAAINPIDSSGSDSESGSPVLANNQGRRVARVSSESGSENSSSVIRRRSRGPRRLPSENESDWSDRGFEGSSQWETDVSDTEQAPAQANVPKIAPEATIDSDSSDGQAETCPICLLSFKKQEIGTPESCDHMFCLECLQEWSKTMNTCPVDRQEYNLILVRQHLNGKVINRLPIEKPVILELDIVEDPTFCEICGSSENEDRLLLCDGCDLGFHLYCLNPPLDSVPADEWYCTVCNTDNYPEVEDANFEAFFRHRGDFYATRLVPRTRQSERVRRRIANNRQRMYSRNRNQEQTAPTDVEIVEAVSSSTSRWRTTKKKRTKRKKTTSQVRYKTVYEIDEITGLTVAVKKRQRKKSMRSRRRKTKTRNRPSTRPATVKNRLARQLGMCASRSTAQNLPDVKIMGSTATISGMRHQAGIPTLHLFGPSSELDYFSEDSEREYNVGPQLVTRRAPNHSDVAILRQVARRKNAITLPTVSSTTDLLGSIMNSQEQFHSRNASYSLDSDGKFKIETKESSKIDITKEHGKVRETPYNPNRNNYYNNRYNSYSNYSNNNYNSRRYNNYYNSSSQNQNYYQSASSSSNNTFYNREGAGNFEDDEFPQDYTQRTLCANNDINEQNRREQEENSEMNPNESEVDIYSDIETVTTTRMEPEGELRPPPTPPDFPSEFNLDEDDSEPDMVIDDKPQEQGRDDNMEDSAVTSTVGFLNSFPFPPPSLMMSVPPPPIGLPVSHSLEEPHSSVEIPPKTVHSSVFPMKPLIPYDDDDSSDGCPNMNIYSKQSDAANDDDDMNDGCPNFSIYSRESKNVALHTDISLPPPSAIPFPQDYQVGEVSSSPNIANQCDRQETAAVEDDNMYNPEEETELFDERFDEPPQNNLNESCVSPVGSQEDSTSKIEENQENKEEDQLESEANQKDFMQENEYHEEKHEGQRKCQEIRKEYQQENLDEYEPEKQEEYESETKGENESNLHLSNDTSVQESQDIELSKENKNSMDDQTDQISSQDQIQSDEDENHLDNDVPSNDEEQINFDHQEQTQQSPESEENRPPSEIQADTEQDVPDTEHVDSALEEQNLSESQVNKDKHENDNLEKIDKLRVAVVPESKEENDSGHKESREVKRGEEEKTMEEVAGLDNPPNLLTEAEKLEGLTNPSPPHHPFSGLANPFAPEMKGGTPPTAKKRDQPQTIIKGGVVGGLYSDSEDENVVKKIKKSAGLSDINQMTEDISEEERSYTPCLDERGNRQGLDGLDTEAISDDDRNDFDESHELKTGSDGDALEINAKESELDFTRPEDYEEGEIVDKNKDKEAENHDITIGKEKAKSKSDDGKDKKRAKKKDKTKTTENDKNANKENEANKDSSFKKLSKNNKERNYRDKDKETSLYKSKSKDKKKEKRKEIERYNVRAIIAEKPRPLIAKDQFGRDIRRTPSKSRSRSYTPPIQRSVSRGRSPTLRARKSLSRPHRSLSRLRTMSPRRQSPSRQRRKRRRSGRSRSRSPRKSPKSKTKRRKRSTSRYKKKKSIDRGEKRKRKRRSHSRHRSLSLRRGREWEERREWTSVSMSPEPPQHVMSPSWTPPRMMDNSQALRSEQLTVTVNNSGKRKKDKRKGDKRNKENSDRRRRRRQMERERTPPPSKEVFASGDNILVSVSFNNDNEIRDVTTRDKRKNDEARKRRERTRRRNKKDLSGIKPVAIIDLDRSPFRELTPSPKAVIVLTDSDNDHENERDVQQTICDSSQQVASPERSINYSMGPKTPPEPQVKFTLSAKTPQIRAISNPLHEPDDLEGNDIHDEEIDSRMNDNMHKGPNTPPEPPTSPPSSPDAYDPFEPTKSRSPTPEPTQTAQSNSINLDEHSESRIDTMTGLDLEKAVNPAPDISKSLTPPLLDVQPADSQSSIQATPENNIKSPERMGVVVSQTVQATLNITKPVAQTTPFSSVPPSIVTSTPVSSTLQISRINILNSTVITPPTSIPQRIVLPNQIKSSPVKISPTKAAVKSTPIKPMPTKNTKSSGKKRTQNGSSIDDIVLDFDSPYSPGSSDYDDLFDPPNEIIAKSTNKKTTKSPQKNASTFDALFGSPNYNRVKSKSDSKNKYGKKSLTPTKTKTVGVKLDEDNLKILDELPNSAVEMLVKDKFLKKLNRQERVVEEVKLVLKPHYNKKKITKEEYKDIMRRAVPKICHNKSGEINPTKIQKLIEAYVRKVRHNKKVTSSSSINPQKV